MTKKIIFCIILFYILILIQTSFSVYFKVLDLIPNLVLIAVVFITLFTPQQWWGVSAALIGGFYLDIFSLSNIGFFGFYTLVLLLFSFLSKIILQKYVRIPLFKRI
ncbi:MAG: hypothetical protein PHE52_01360 [Candidatus Pacebacteria bacterium]|nr:hypothetical protein [Candidatus Paceibacterota bacterium]